MQNQLLFYLLPLVAVVSGIVMIKLIFEDISMKWMALYIIYPIIPYLLTHIKGYNMYTLCLSIIAPLLITHIITDINETELIDVITLIILIIGMINFGYYIYKGALLKDMAIQYGMSALVMLVVYFIIALATQEALGGGDIKLVGVLGLFIHFNSVGKFLVYPMVIGILIAIVLLILGKKKDTLFPFGPAIILGFYLTFLI